MILDENNRMNQQVEAILNLHSLNDANMRHHFETVNINTVVEEVVSRFLLQAENIQGKIVWTTSAVNPYVNGNSSQLSIALGNLVDNALKYTKGKPEVMLNINESGSDIIIEVMDHGMGIPSEYLEKIFDRYFRVPEGDTHTVKGFGLGLAYVKQVVELHRGTIQVKSDVGKGTTFTIRLPHA